MDISQLSTLINWSTITTSRIIAQKIVLKTYPKSIYYSKKIIRYRTKYVSIKKLKYSALQKHYQTLYKYFIKDEKKKVKGYLD